MVIQSSPQTHGARGALFASPVGTSYGTQCVGGVGSGHASPTSTFRAPGLGSTSVDVHFGQEMQPGGGGRTAVHFAGAVAENDGTAGFHPSLRASPAWGLGGRFTSTDRGGPQNYVDNGDAKESGREGASNRRENRRNQQRRQLADYMQQRRVQSGDKIHIPTDEEGDVRGLRTIFHNAIQDVAGHVLDISAVNFQEHPRVAMDIIEHDLRRQLYTDLPLCGGYIRKYLMNSLCTSRYRWRKHWKRIGQCHPIVWR
jgi:hypothetical protein